MIAPFFDHTGAGSCLTSGNQRGIQTPINLSVGAREFRHASTCRSEQLARTSALEAARNSGIHQLLGRSNWPGHPLSKPHGGPRPNSSRRSSRVRDHLTGEVERFAPSGRPWAAGWSRQAAQLFNGQVVLGRLDGLTRGIVRGGKIHLHRRAISSSDHGSAMSGRLRSTR